MSWTREEQNKINELRKAEREEGNAAAARWNTAGAGYEETGTVYLIEYRDRKDDLTWYGASPFYDPVRVDTSETHDLKEAERIAELLMRNEWAVNRHRVDRADNGVSAVRIVERTSSALIRTVLS